MENLPYGTAIPAVSTFVKHNTSTLQYNKCGQVLTLHLIIAMDGIGVSFPYIYANNC